VIGVPLRIVEHAEAHHFEVENARRQVCSLTFIFSKQGSKLMMAGAQRQFPAGSKLAIPTPG
jgi:hypothetical protein